MLDQRMSGIKKTIDRTCVRLIGESVLYNLLISLTISTLKLPNFSIFFYLFLSITDRESQA